MLLCFITILLFLQALHTPCNVGDLYCAVNSLLTIGILHK